MTRTLKLVAVVVVGCVVADVIWRNAYANGWRDAERNRALQEFHGRTQRTA